MTILSAEAVNWSLPSDGIDVVAMDSQRLTMRLIDPADVHVVVETLADVQRMFEFWPEPKTHDQIMEWIGQRTCWCFYRKDNDHLAIVGTTERDACGGLVVHGFSTGRGDHSLSLEAMRLGEAVCFSRLGAHRLTSYLTSVNIAAIRLLEASAWKLEGSLRKAARIGSEYRDVLVYAKLKGE